MDSMMTAQPAGSTYTCPMHPEVRQQQPGSCPKCGMKLEPAKDGDHGASMAEPMVMMMREHYTPYRWVHGVTAALGLWLIASPSTLGTGGVQAWSDIGSGVIVLVLAAIASRPEKGWASWSHAIVGLWLLAAPLLFWADAASYTNNTLVGALLIAFGFLIPMSMQMGGPEVPQGWSYNPSAWSQRAPIIALAFLGFLISRYMAAFQMGHIDSVWDPFFGDGTERVLRSDVSRAFPVSDAGLGAMTYMIEVLMAFMGDPRRWRTMPWMVAAFGVVVVPLGVVSIVLVIMQPVVVGAWCTPCLVTAVLMLAMIPLALDEVVAMIQFVRRERHAGKSAWRVFWLGGNQSDDARTWQPTRDASWKPAGMLWGVTATWTLWLAAALGLWLMFAPDVLASTGTIADSDHLVGAVVIVVAVTAMAEIARPARFLNVPLGAWLAIVPWFFDAASTAARANSAAAGIAIILASLPLGKLRDHYGTFDRALVWRPRRKQRERRRTWGSATAH